MASAGGDGNMHVLSLAGVVGNGERGGNVEDRICVAEGGEEVVGFHTQPIQCGNVVTMNL